MVDSEQFVFVPTKDVNILAQFISTFINSSVFSF